MSPINLLPLADTSLPNSSADAGLLSMTTSSSILEHQGRERLKKHGLYASLSFYPLRGDEARRLPLLFLDLTEEAAVLYDRNSFLETTLLELKRRLLKQGAKRVIVDKEHWYWDLKPDYSFGEKAEIA